MKCTKCKEEKSENDFYRRSDREGYYSSCKSCFNKANTEKLRRKKKEMIKYKNEKCNICGIKDECPAIYDFHHINPKENDFKMSQLTQQSFKKLKKELDKCILVCSNCHRKIHYGDIA